MADVGFYGNQLKKLLTDPSSFSGSPGYQFALKQGLDSVNASNSAMRGSGNVLAALTQYGTGLAQQDYGNTVDRYGRLLGQEQGYDINQGNVANTATANANSLALGTEANRLTGLRNANDFTLGQGQNANAATRNANDLTLGQGQNANTARANDQQFGLGMYRAGNDYNLGMTNAGNTAQKNWWDYNLGGQQNNITAANNQNNFNVNQGRNAIDWFNANTNRGTAASNSNLDWLKAYPVQRYA